MKPDGTHTIEEVCAIMDNELQSWERIEIGNRYCDPSLLYDDDGYASDVDISDFSTDDLIDELLLRRDEEYILDHLDIDTDIIPYLEDKGYIVKEE